MAEIQIQTLVVPDAFVGPKLQAAIDQAAGMLVPQTAPAGVWIPATYKGTDTYTNPNNVPVFDLRNGGSISFANGALIPNTTLPFSATPVFNVAQSASYTMTLTGNVASSSTIGTAKNGNLLSLTLIEDGTGGWTFAFPANFVFPAGYSFDTVVGHTNALTFKFDGTNWNLISNAGGGGGNPSGANNTIQKNNSGAFGASSITDTGALVTVGNAATFSSTATVTGRTTATGGLDVGGASAANTGDFHSKGPNPYIDVTNYFARAVSTTPSTTGSINASSATLTLAAASTFQNGDGIVVRGAGANMTLTTPSAPTVVASNAQVYTGTGLTVANSSGATTYQYQVVAQDLGGGYTPASSLTSIANGPATLGSQNVNITSWSQANNTVTVVTASAHNLVAGAMVLIAGAGNANGWWQVATAADNTHFTFTTSDDTRLGAAASGGAAGTVTWWMCNHITWTPVTNAFRYLIYGRTSGAMNLIGVTMPQSSTFGITITGDPLQNSFDDFGATMTANISSSNVPDWVPLTPPVSAKNDDLVTTIVSGAGTTTLTLTNTASNTVASATVKFDNTPNIVAAALAASANKTGAFGVLYFPAPGTGSTFVTNSVMDLRQFPRVLSVMQSGTLVLGDTMILGQCNWSGQPTVATASGTFTRTALPQIVSSTAMPMIYGPNVAINMDHMTLTHNSPQGQIMVEDQGNLPGGLLEKVQFATSGNDYMAQHFVLRSDTGGGSNLVFRGCTFVGGLTNTLGVTATPLVYFDGMGGPFYFVDTFLNRRGIFNRPNAIGAQMKFDLIYEQGGIMPMISTYSAGSVISHTIDIGNLVILDTMAAPLFTWYGSPNGTVVLPGVLPGSGQPPFNGPSVSLQVLQSPALNNVNNAQFTVTQSAGTAVTGLAGSTSTQADAQTQSNAQIILGSNYQLAALPQAQAAPTCSVSAGGTVSVASYTFKVAPVFPGGGEGLLSPASPTCTTSSGNQTITITWAAVPGAIGYDLYENGFSFQCGSPLVSGGNTTQYVWSGVSPCGVSAPSMPGSGVSGLNANAVWSPKLTVSGNGFQSDITAPALTANRTFQLPDANVLPLSLGTNDISYFTGASTTGLTNVQNTIVSSSNQLTGGTAGAWNGAAITNPGTNPYGFANDQAASVTLGTIGAGNAQVNVCVRMPQNALSGYCAGINTNSNTFFFQKFTGGGAGAINSASITAAVGDYVFISAVGQTITAQRWVAGTLVNNFSTTDSTYTSGAPGLGIFSNTSKGQNFQAYSLKSYPTIDNTNDWTSVQNFPEGIRLGSTINQALLTSSGNSGRVGSTSGTLTNGDLASFDANGNIVDSAVVAANVNKLSSIIAATGANSINNGDNAQTWNWALTTAAKTAFKFTENSAATNGAGSQFIGQFVTVAGSTAVPLNVANSLTGSQTLPALSITPTWNTTGVVDAALLVNPTNTASATGSLLIDAQLGGTSQWKVDKAGNVTQLGTISLGSTPPSCTPGTAGGECLNEGTAPTNGSSSIAFYADSTAHELKAATSGTNNFGLLVRTQPGAINQTGQTASIATATLCAASPGACNIAGQYKVSWNIWGSGTACSNVTAGSVSFNLTWTDENATAHSAVVIPMTVQTGATTTAIQSTMPFQTALANEGGSGDITISSSGAAAIQYSTTYTACTTGTGTYNLRATVTRLQ